MRKLINAGLVLALLVLTASPAIPAEPPDAPGDLNVVELVLDWLGISMEKGSPPDHTPGSGPPSDLEPSTSDDQPTDGPPNEIGPINDPGG